MHYDSITFAKQSDISKTKRNMYTALYFPYHICNTVTSQPGFSGLFVSRWDVHVF